MMLILSNVVRAGKPVFLLHYPTLDKAPLLQSLSGQGKKPPLCYCFTCLLAKLSSESASHIRHRYFALAATARTLTHVCAG